MTHYSSTQIITINNLVNSFPPKQITDPQKPILSFKGVSYLKFTNEFYPTCIAKIKIPTIVEDAEQQKRSYTAGRSVP